MYFCVECKEGFIFIGYSVKFIIDWGKTDIHGHTNTYENSYFGVFLARMGPFAHMRIHIFRPTQKLWKLIFLSTHGPTCTYENLYFSAHLKAGEINIS